MNITWQHHLVQRILHVSSAIHRSKERMARQEIGMGAGIRVIFLELWLRILSLPAYLLVRRDVIVETFAKHPDDVVRYRSRPGMLNSALRERTKDSK
jgi:hypothetical protein